MIKTVVKYLITGKDQEFITNFTLKQLSISHLLTFKWS